MAQTTRRIKCVCSGSEAAKFQDEKYGKGIRIANLKKSTSGVEYRCTVCGKEHRFSE